MAKRSSSRSGSDDPKQKRRPHPRPLARRRAARRQQALGGADRQTRASSGAVARRPGRQFGSAREASAALARSETSEIVPKRERRRDGHTPAAGDSLARGRASADQRRLPQPSGSDRVGDALCVATASHAWRRPDRRQARERNRGPDGQSGLGDGGDEHCRVWTAGSVVLLVLVGVLDEAAGGCERGSLGELGEVFVEEHAGDEFLA
jgi:hypothetical protein